MINQNKLITARVISMFNAKCNHHFSKSDFIRDISIDKQLLIERDKLFILIKKRFSKSKPDKILSRFEKNGTINIDEIINNLL